MGGRRPRPRTAVRRTPAHHRRLHRRRRRPQDRRRTPGRRPHKHTISILRAHRSRQLNHRDRRHAAGNIWIDSGYVFTRKDGQPINPNYATTRFRKLTERAGLPPVRLHDLRHGAASLAHEAGVDLKPLQDLLGHSSIVVTADYTSVLPDSQRRCADATAALVLAAARHTRKRIKEKAAKNRPAGRDEKQTPSEKRPATTKRNNRSQAADARIVTEGDDTHVAPN